VAARRPSKTTEAPSEGADELSFEAALAELDAIVERLERGDIELEAALAAFEQGVSLTRRCAEQLERAERRVEMLMREGEKWLVRPFEGSEESD
jgi:exodeoxyribonuclease VII small subunit